MAVDGTPSASAVARIIVVVTGVVGILLRAAREGEVDIECELPELREVGFRIGDELYERAIDSVRDE